MKNKCTACAPHLDETYSLTVCIFVPNNVDLVRGVLLFTFSIRLFFYSLFFAFKTDKKLFRLF